MWNKNDFTNISCYDHFCNYVKGIKVVPKVFVKQLHLVIIFGNKGDYVKASSFRKIYPFPSSIII